MENEILWKDNQNGDTQFGIQGGRLKLKQLFGTAMETDAELAARVTGVFDLFTSLGSVAGKQELQELTNQNDVTEAKIILYGGRMQYRITWVKEGDILRRRDSLINCSKEPVTIHKAKMRFVFSYQELEAYTQNTRWCYENIGSWAPVTFGGVHLACEGGRTTQGATPFLALRGKNRKGLAFHLAPKGNWEIALQTVSRGVSQAGEYAYVLEMGQKSDHLALNLQPGQTYELPDILIQSLPDGSLSKAAAGLQRYFLKHDASRNRHEHPVVYNPWFEHYALLDEKRLKEHVQTAKELGCEVFEIDAGWYGSQKGDWWSQSGDWQERTNGAFYGKMSDFAQYVREQGMGFGLWMEPERIGENTPIRRAHPEYFSLGNGHYYPKLYEPEVYDYLYGEITGLIEKYGLVWMKMDFNFELGEDESRSEFYFYYEAWYRLLEEIKSNYPDTFLEACAAGGERSDLNTTMVYDGHFLSDNVNAWDMQFTYQQNCLRLPHYRLIKWLVINPGAKISLYDSERIEKVDTLATPQRPGAGWDEYESITADFACLLTMAGPMGLSGNYIDITDAQKEVFRRYIVFYKQYRNFYRESVLYLGADPMNVGDRDGFFHLQYHKEGTDESLVFAYRFATAATGSRFFLSGLKRDDRYRMANALTEEVLGEYTGEELMYRGMWLEYESRHSGKVFRISPVS